MREHDSGQGRDRQHTDDEHRERHSSGGTAQADGSDSGPRHERSRGRVRGAFGEGLNEASQGSTGMGAFGEGDFQGGTGGMGGYGQSGYGQDPDIRGGYGQGSGYAQSSEQGGYGQGARRQGGSGQSGSDQQSDMRYGHFSGHGQQRGSQYGYGGRGSEQQGASPQHGTEHDPASHERGEHYGKGPKGYQRSDERIREDVSEQLYRDGHVDASEIEIEVSSGEVTLNGSVASRAEKRRAEDVAERCAGVKDVQNRLRAQSSASSSHSAQS